MKSLLAPTRFFNSMQDETLPSQACPPTNIFFSRPEISTCLRTYAEHTKIFDSSSKLFFSLSASFLIVALYFAKNAHFPICSIIRFTLCLAEMMNLFRWVCTLCVLQNLIIHSLSKTTASLSARHAVDYDIIRYKKGK